jgi:hypothetical protein
LVTLVLVGLLAKLVIRLPESLVAAGAFASGVTIVRVGVVGAGDTGGPETMCVILFHVCDTLFMGVKVLVEGEDLV